jgi:putative ABC transport system permease protein
MNDLGIALRNLLRNRRRSLTTLAAMTVGAVTILLFGGYSRDILYGLETQTVQRIGHLQIQRQGYFLYGTGDPGAYGIAAYDDVIAALRRDPVLAPMLSVVTPTLTLGGIAGNFAAGVSRTVYGGGAIVEEQARMRDWNDYGLRSDRRTLALTGTPPDAVVIGTGVARTLRLCEAFHVPDCPPLERQAAEGAEAPADVASLVDSEAAARGEGRAGAVTGPTTRIELLAANAHGAPNVASLQVVRAENQGVKELDDMFVSMHLQQAQRLVYGGEAPRATAIVIQLAHTAQLDTARRRIDQLLSTSLAGRSLEVRDFATLNPFYGQAVAMFSAIFGFIAVLIAAIVLFTVGNTMTMAVVERTTEIGTLRAIGLRRRGIRRLFVREGLLLGAIGALAGLLAALGVAWMINHSGLTWQPPGQAGRVPLTVRIWGEGALVTGTTAMLVAVATLSAWWPSRRAAQMNIVDALRHV